MTLAAQNVRRWGEEVLGVKADAVNLWLGDDRAVSSMHKVVPPSPAPLPHCPSAGLPSRQPICPIPSKSSKDQ